MSDSNCMLCEMSDSEDSGSEAPVAAKHAQRSAASVGATPASPANSNRALSPAPAKGDKEKKGKVKVDAFQFDAGTQFNQRVGFAGHDPKARIAAEAIGPGPLPAYCVGMAGAFKSMRKMVSKKKKRFTEDGYDLDLTYITPKIIAMGFPSSGREGLYRNPLPEVQKFFEQRHAGRYRIYNLCSERAYDPSDFLGRVARYPFDDHNPCPLHLLGAFCADVDAWLTGHPENVVAVHCKAGKGRTGTVIAAYLMHCGYKASSEAALKCFGYARTANGKGVTIASQMRYVHYYEQILRVGFPVTYTYRLTHVRMRTVPNFDQLTGGCTPWFQVFIDNVKVFDYKKAVGGSKGLVKWRKGDLYADMDCTGFDIRLANNIKFQFCHESSAVSKATGMSSTVKMCHLWFHTGFISRNYLVFTKGVIDKASKDKKGHFHPAFAIEFYMHRVAAPPSPPLDDSSAAATGLSLEEGPGTPRKGVHSGSSTGSTHPGARSPVNSLVPARSPVHSKTQDV